LHLSDCLHIFCCMTTPSGQSRKRLQEARRAYRCSPKGREAARRYQSSPLKGAERNCVIDIRLGLLRQLRYRHSLKALLTRWRYRRSPKGLETQRQYERTSTRLEYKREWALRYRTTEKYKERQLERHYKRADAMLRELIKEGQSRHPARVEQFHRLQDFRS
jgi:hypothetical protein